MPGLHSVEYPLDGDVLGGSPSSTTRFTIRVDDEQFRFLPTVFRVDVPYRGIFPTETPPSPGAVAPPGVYLFSAPTRPAPSTLAVVRAQLVEQLDATTTRPAAFAVLEVQMPGPSIWYGVADSRGAVLVVFPYPAFAVSPGVPTSPTSTLQSWAAVVRVRYSPSSLDFPPGSATPDIRSVFGQPIGQIWPTSALDPAQAVVELSGRLFFGQPLVLRTDSGPDLVIGPA
ncbi:MAG: hypothetical protein ACREOS_07290, partial [Candidatus Dormibacteraceae bacterium]